MSKDIEIKKEKYDYYYNRDGESIVTVCYLLTKDGIVGRGVSVRSETDERDEIIGKRFAKKYALRAIKGRPLDNFVRSSVIDQLIRTKCPFIKKGEKNPDLNWWERKFLFGKNNMTAYITKIGFSLILRNMNSSFAKAAGEKLRLAISKKLILSTKETTIAKMRQTFKHLSNCRYKFRSGD